MNESYNIIVKEAKIDPELERKNIFLEHGVGYQLCNECLDDRNLANLTAFIGNNDMVSYGIMDAILKKGYQIPDDFSVCGFDNDFASSLLPISLTTVEHYMEDKGKKAFDMIYEKIQETGYEPDEIAIVGDRLYTDIAVADQSDAMSILVLSGESTREDVKTSDVKPNVILEDLSEITKML